MTSFRSRDRPAAAAGPNQTVEVVLLDHRQLLSRLRFVDDAAAGGRVEGGRQCVGRDLRVDDGESLLEDRVIGLEVDQEIGSARDEFRRHLRVINNDERLLLTAEDITETKFEV